MKTKRIIIIVISVLLAVALVVGIIISAGQKKNENYAGRINTYQSFSNTVETAMPQTVIHKLIKDHFNSPLAEGKKTKKAIFIGYDGFRTDALENIAESKESAVMYVGRQGGLYHTFSGGVKGKEQATSTAPSWMAMLTGGWGDYNGVTDNSQMKNIEASTFLTALAKQGHTASFTTSWREHTELTYRPDIITSIKENLPIEYTHQMDDTATYYQVLKYVSNPKNAEKTPDKDPDIIFFTLEYADHAGHTTGFGNQNSHYIDGCVNDDKYGYDIVKTIEQRCTFDEEDWLILISTDHGGTDKHHGGQTDFERCTWLATNKQLKVDDTLLNYGLK